jgi:hypothetical protein
LCIYVCICIYTHIVNVCHGNECRATTKEEIKVEGCSSYSV